MALSEVEKKSALEQIIQEDLKPFVKKVDEEAFYAKRFLQRLGEAGLFSSSERSPKDCLPDEMDLVRETAKICMTTAFCLWCHLAALTYVRHTGNKELQEKLLSPLESGEVLGATGLSNPMKYYAGLEKLQLTAKQVEGGYLVSGVLPSVSNLGEDHWFGFVADAGDRRIMGMVPCTAEHLSLKEKIDYLAVNGSATYACAFKDVFIPNEWLISGNADDFIPTIRPYFLAYQIPLGLGVTESSIASIQKVCNKQNGCNSFLNVQADELRKEEKRLFRKLEDLLAGASLDWKEIADIRLQAAYLTLKAVQASMLHNGSAGYLQYSAPSRRLREAYFFANLTPTVKHLEKILHL